MQQAHADLLQHAAAETLCYCLDDGQMQASNSNCCLELLTHQNLDLAFTESVAQSFILYRVGFESFSVGR